MRTHFIWLVAWKELISTWRDKRTLQSTILTPMIMIPFFIIGLPLLLGSLIGGQQLEKQKVGVIGLERIPAGLKAALEGDKKQNGTVISRGVTLEKYSGDPQKAVQDGTLEAVLELPAVLPSTAGGAPVSIKVYAKLSSLRGQTGATSKVQEAIRAYSDTLVKARLERSGLPSQTLTPIVAQSVDASTTEERRSGQLAFIIPLFIMQFILAGGMPTAIDSTAGEKERGTLEVLLVSPVGRLEVVLGKFMAVTIFALLTALASMVGLLLSSMLAGVILPAVLGSGREGSSALAQAFGGNLTLDVPTFFTLLAVALSVALVVSVLMVAICVYARSFKEAQGYLTPLLIVVSLTAVLLQFSDFLNAGAAFYAIPILGAELAILDVVKGRLELGNIAISVVSNILASFVFLAWALNSFKRESVIFRS
ncbi:MAG: ABC transporter permease [Pseudopedobacter sp.]|nr:ABC transporter permease [Deinococcales bacterium]